MRLTIRAVTKQPYLGAEKKIQSKMIHAMTRKQQINHGVFCFTIHGSM